MSSSLADAARAMAQKVAVSRGSLIVNLTDGRTITVPLSWYPRLLHGTPSERRKWRLIGRGVGIHWPDLDEDISVHGLLAGVPSNESPSSLQKWLRARGLKAKRPRVKRAGIARPKPKRG